MKVSAINSMEGKRVVPSFSLQSQPTIETKPIQPDSFSRTTTTTNIDQTSFRGSPWRLNIGQLEYATQISGKQAIEIFKNFRLGNYLDLNGITKSYSDSLIRKQNLAFLDKVIDRADKKEFIDHYKELTGFPDLSAVAYKLKRTFKDAVNKTEASLKADKNSYHSEYYDVMTFGYDGISSVAKDKALPGSDLDKAFIILRGAGIVSADRYEQDEDIINEFKGRLWENTDQRILSYNHDADSFPKIYTEFQLQQLIRAIDAKNIDMSTIGKKIGPLGFIEIIARTIFEKDTPSHEYNDDYIDANSYFIKLCKQFPVRGDWELDVMNPSRENIYSFGFILEALKWGEHFKDNYRNYWINTSNAPRHLNVSQIYSLRHRQGTKEKLVRRSELENNFNNWDIDTQFLFIKNLILGSCGETTNAFPQYFSSNTADKFQELMREIGL